MEFYLTIALVLWLQVRVWRSSHPAAELESFLCSCLLTIPIVIVGNSASAAIFAIDITFVSILVKKLHRSGNAAGVRSDVTSSRYLAVLALCCAISSVVNYFVEPENLKFYFFTTVKFTQYSIVSWLIARHYSNRAIHDGFRLEPYHFRFFLVLAILYHALHLAHLGSILDLSGRAYFGPRIEEVIAYAGMDPFADRRMYFLTAFTAATGGISTINAFMALHFGTTSRSVVSRRLSNCLFVLSFLSIIGSTSRSDTVGFAVAISVYCVCALILGKAKTASFPLLTLLVIPLVVVSYWIASDDLDSLNKMVELFDDQSREVGTYASRTNDRSAIIAYFADYPPEFLFGSGPGNFRRYGIAGITMNWFGHNSYIHWLGELGTIGFLAFLAWLSNSVWKSLKPIFNHSSSPKDGAALAAVGLSLLLSRCISAWGTESLLGTDGMGYCSIYLVATFAFFSPK